jgi:predicted ester cyclase
MNAHDADGFAAICSPTVEFTEGGTRMQGQEQIRELWLGYFSAFPDMRLEVMDAVESDDTLAAETRFTGTNTGPMQGPSGEMPPSGRSVAIDSCDYIKIVGDRIQSWHVYIDMADFMGQLGATPTPAESVAAT